MVTHFVNETPTMEPARIVALATVADVDALVSRDFKHIVRLEKIRVFNAVIVELGYGILSILSPREVGTHEAD
jgi:hypothetical protein